MSSINLNTSASALDQLRTINAMAQSLGGSSAGRIGLINTDGKSRVIKFNTHLGERLFGAAKTSAMQESCDVLRVNICALLDDSVGKIDQKLCEKLKATINKGKNKKLLDRDIVASVIKDVETATNKNREEWMQPVSLDGTEYDMYNSDSTGRDTDFETVSKRAKEEGAEVPVAKKKALTASSAGKVVDKTVDEQAPIGEDVKKKKTAAELATVTFDESKVVPPKEGADSTEKIAARQTNLENLGKQLAASFKEITKNQDVREAIKSNPHKIDLNLKRTDEYMIEDVNDLNYVSTSGDIDIVAGQTADIAQRYGEGTLILAYGDCTDFGCGIDKKWTTQEENQFDVCNPDYFTQIVADDDAVEERHKEGDDEDCRRWKYRDDVARPLDPTTGYFINQEIVRDGYGVALPKEKCKKIDLQIASFPSFRTNTSEDPRGVLKFLCKCRGIQSTPLTPQLKNAQTFIDAVIERANEHYTRSDGLEDKLLTDDQKKELMKLVMFSGDNDIFKIFSDDTAGEVDKLINYVRANKHKKCGADNLSLLDKAQANYKNTMVKVVSGWVSAARQRGIKYFLGGPIGCGEFANKKEDVAEIFAEAFAKHGGDMKFVYCQFEIDPTTQPNSDARIFQQAFKKKFDEVQTKLVKPARSGVQMRAQLGAQQPGNGTVNTVPGVIPPPPPMPGNIQNNLNPAGNVNKLNNPQSNAVKSLAGERTKPSKPTESKDEKNVEQSKRKTIEKRHVKSVMEDFVLDKVTLEDFYADSTRVAETVSDNIKTILDSEQSVDEKALNVETYLKGIYNMLFEKPGEEGLVDEGNDVVLSHLDGLKRVAEKISSADKSVMEKGVQELHDLLDQATDYWSKRPDSPVQNDTFSYQAFAAHLELNLA